MIPDKEHASETKTVSTKSEKADIYQEIIFKNIHFNRFQVRGNLKKKSIFKEIIQTRPPQNVFN